MNYKYRFSVFTATYNRGHLLRNVYNDLLNQTFKDFEWVVINDGSADDTDSIMKSIIDEGKLSIQYVSKKNGGKHTAWREATRIFLGRYIVGADDDDIMPSDALEIFHSEWCKLEKQPNYNEFWEIRARVSRDGQNIHGKALTQSPFDSSYIDINFKHKFGTLEMQGCRKVEILRNEAAVPEEFIFEDQCSNFPEVIRWIRASRKYKTRFIDKIVRVYNEADESSLTRVNSGPSRNRRLTFNGLIGDIYGLNEYRDLLVKYSFSSYLFKIICFDYHCCALNLGSNIRQQLSNSTDRFLSVIFMPISRLLYYFRR